mmetsp:Transcript_21478/g.46552  ORF Transcript_21478/g.46552 Transcript_21478/m.46552 type:complete len:112 (+) Transcript_21478:461-796(+)|eukprot:CAMPEP_0168803764 /NCGR_PEP_ID=MMETSP0726-20121227/165_1 /TAXON_ID=265536 /ORGANISM="Amphiprora sp., Strain CCMP467" /LENGTH=111 /DNA_ID=CAMNT_0008855581 /DNA_START=420 /DNA_END=755 /DNA_ORIENTATION=-
MGDPFSPNIHSQMAQPQLTPPSPCQNDTTEPSDEAPRLLVDDGRVFTPENGEAKESMHVNLYDWTGSKKLCRHAVKAHTSQACLAANQQGRSFNTPFLRLDQDALWERARS